MLDVHPPSEPIHGIRDFMLHLLTITIGLLIALGLEGIVEWRHHIHLRHEADINLRQEIETNRKDLDEALKAVPDEQRQFKEIIAALQPNAKPAEHQTLRVAYTFANPQDASWQTANATGALAYMDFNHVQRYAAIYQLQRQMETLQNATFGPVVELEATLLGGDPANLSAADRTSTIQQAHLMMAHIETNREVGVALRQAYEEALKETN